MKTFCLILSLLSLLAAPAYADTAVKAQTLAKTTQSWDGRPLPAYPAGTPEITVVTVEIPPHTQLPLHQHPVINVGVMISGELTVVTEANETLHLKAGDSIVEVTNKWHYGKNDGDVPAVISVVYVGTPGTPITLYKK